MSTNDNNNANGAADDQQAPQYYHGTKAQLNIGDTIVPGFRSNYGKGREAKYVYLTATLNAAIWGAELALGDAPQRIYIVAPTGFFEDDPNLTDKKFPGNPTKSYRTQHPVRIVGEITEWQGHPEEELTAMKNNVARSRELGIEAIED
jgi:hypothetical protein